MKKNSRGNPHLRIALFVLTIAVLLGLGLVLRAAFLPGGPGPAATPTGPATSGQSTPTAAPPDPTWSVTRPAAGLPGDAALVFTTDGRPLVSFVETSGSDAGQRVWYAYDADTHLLRRVPLVRATIPYDGRTVHIGLFRENGRTRCLAYGDEGVPRLFSASDGTLYYADPANGVFRFDPTPPPGTAGAAAPTKLTPDHTSDGYDREALLAFERKDDASLTWVNRPRIDDALGWLVYTTDRRGFANDGDTHADLRQVDLTGGSDTVVALDARPVAFVGDVLVYEKRDLKLYLRATDGAGGPASAAETPWTGVLDQYDLFGPWLVYTTTDGGTKHFFGQCPATPSSPASFRSITCAVKGRIANLYRMSPDGVTLGLVWLTDRSSVASARLVALSLPNGATRIYDLKAALSKDAPIDSFTFEGWVSDDSVLVAAIRAGQAPTMRIVDLADLSPVAASSDLTVQAEGAG